MLLGTATAGYKEATIAAKKGDFVFALREFTELSSQGDAPSQYALGVMYHFGRGQPRNFEEAQKWYRMAVKSEYAPALNNLATMYRFGQGVKIDLGLAFKMYKVRQKDPHSRRLMWGRCTPKGSARRKVCARPRSGIIRLPKRTLPRRNTSLEPYTKMELVCPKIRNGQRRGTKFRRKRAIRNPRLR